MTVRIGTIPIEWSNDDLRELGGGTPLETCLAEAHAAGFTGIELGHKFPRDAATLRQVLDAHRLTLVSGWYSAALLQRDAATELAAMRPHLALLKALGWSRSHGRWVCCRVPATGHSFGMGAWRQTAAQPASTAATIRPRAAPAYPAGCHRTATVPAQFTG